MIILQEIVTQWTKASRGGEGVTARNGVPEMFPLPDRWSGVPTVETLLYQHLYYGEYDTFKVPTFSIKDLGLPPDRWTHLNGGLALRLYPDGLAVEWRWTGDVGAPKRNRYPCRVVLLQTGEWAMIRFNGRFNYSYTWMYRKTVVHIGVVDRYDDQIFTQPLVAIFESIADLW